MKKRSLLVIKIAACAIVLVSLSQIIRIVISKRQAEDAFVSVRTVYSQNGSSDKALATNDEAKNRASDVEKALSVNSGIAALQKKNDDCAGWLTVDGTNIDYPVMYTPDDEEYYLAHDFERKDNYHGVPFIDAHGSPDSDNPTIYGHSMRDGTMFSELSRFTDTSFCEAGHQIRFTTLYDERVYRAVCVFKISQQDSVKFPYHLFSDFSPVGVTASDYIARAKYYAIWYDDTVTAADDHLLTLSTCEYTLDNGRLVVIAKAIYD